MTTQKDLERGLCLLQQGNLDEAEKVYRMLLKKGHTDAEVYCNLGIICGLTNRPRELRSLLEAALESNPGYPQAHNNMGIAYHELGEYKMARYYYQNAIRLNPEYAEAYFNLGNLLMDQGDCKAASISYQQAIRIRPYYTNALTNLGHSQLASGESLSAIKSFSDALSICPEDPDLISNVGCGYLRINETKKAIIHFKAALDRQPSHSDALLNLALAYKHLGSYDEATIACKTALECHPRDPESHNLMGTLLREKNQHSQAINSYRIALRIDPSNPTYYCNLGNALHCIGEIANAVEAYTDALRLKPDYHEARLNLAMALLLLGKYEEGLRLYETRLDPAANQPLFPVNPAGRPWQGERLNSNESLIIISEQGLGDTLQMMRYVPLLREQHENIVVIAPWKLHGLMMESGITDNPQTPEQIGNYPYDPWVSMMSLPYRLGINPQSAIHSSAYIRINSEAVRHWAVRLEAKGRTLIGLNWQGNPHHETTISKGRSLSLEDFSPLKNALDSRFVSLQKGYGSEQLATCSFKDHFVSCQDEVDEAWDFLDAAAIIKNCDLVITSDTSVAHLAGGLGKTCWLLLQHVPEWRWGLKGESTSWYPTIRLFRQQVPGDWAGVIERVHSELRKATKNWFGDSIDATP